MPNRWIRDANNVLQLKGTVGGLVDATVVNADIANASIQASKLDYFKSTVQTANGSEQSIAHTLGRTPSLVLVIVQDDNAVADVAIVEGTHTSTNCLVTITSAVDYIVFAL